MMKEKAERSGRGRREGEGREREKKRDFRICSPGSRADLSCDQV